jgi:hypothetical protein
MGKQTGPIFLSGTIGGVTFYQRQGEWLLRSKTSLNKKRVSTDPAFEGSRRASASFAVASKLAKKIYWQLPANKRGRGVIGKLTGIVHKKLLGGRQADSIEATLIKNLD